jgi:hypothetical protein
LYPKKELPMFKSYIFAMLAVVALSSASLGQMPGESVELALSKQCVIA